MSAENERVKKLIVQKINLESNDQLNNKKMGLRDWSPISLSKWQAAPCTKNGDYNIFSYLSPYGGVGFHKDIFSKPTRTELQLPIVGR